MNQELIDYIVDRIRNNRSNTEIVNELESLGHSPEAISAAFVEAYEILGLHAGEGGVLRELVRQEAVVYTPTAGEQIQSVDQRLIGFAVIGFGVFLLTVIGFAGYRSLTPVEDTQVVESASEEIVGTEPVVTDEIPFEIQLDVAIGAELNRTGSFSGACDQAARWFPAEDFLECESTTNYYHFIYREGGRNYCFDSWGNRGVPQTQPFVKGFDCNGAPFAGVSEEDLVQPNNIAPVFEDADPRYRSLSFTETSIEFEREGWMSGESLCVGEVFQINYYVSRDIDEVLLGVYQPGFGTPEIETIAALPATLNEDEVPGFGTYFWGVGALQDGTELLPGPSYRFIIRDTDGTASAESASFSVQDCRG